MPFRHTNPGLFFKFSESSVYHSSWTKGFRTLDLSGFSKLLKNLVSIWRREGDSNPR
ncbi:hypothetical protein BN2476_370024 [Paraburkholderia piptadeniae]|uniref:Uncharacterized protein n=1 Tax=Paraburkholderia piptadeniae TaxID=1701573 RepID=A0A1N7S9L2_9BURK|nr:hypothetical protein BN2476_370024 [Paraburkholderia piptadeniae]